jgi:hypothetical protein
MYQRDANKPKAKWTLLKESGQNKLYQSDGGAVKITRLDQDGEEVMVLCCPARAYSQYAMVTEFINETAHDVALSVKEFKDNKDRAKIQLQAQVAVGKLVETLKAAGVSPEQIAAALVKQTA